MAPKVASHGCNSELTKLPPELPSPSECALPEEGLFHLCVPCTSRLPAV